MMLRIRQILLRSISLAAFTGSLGAVGALGGCGQTGPLYLPTEPAAAHRATLPQILLPGPRGTEAPASSTSPATPASSPSSSSQ